MNVLYLALFPNREDSVLRREYFEESPSRLPELLPDAERYFDVVRLIDLPNEKDGRTLTLNADTLKQRVVCYLGEDGKNEGR